MARNPNRLIMGLMTIGPDPGKGARITSLDEFTKCLDYFSSKGYTELDTAAMYVEGQQESFTREAGFQERDFKIATKIMPFNPGDHAPGKLVESWNTSLAKLGVDSVDIMYLHAPDRATSFESTLEGVDKLYQEGKFKHFGLSNYAAWEVAEIVGTCERRGFVKPTIYQGMYNAITRALEVELEPCLRKFGISFVIYNPLAAGLFSGKYSTISVEPSEGRFSDAGGTGPMYRTRYFKESVMKAFAVIEPVAKKYTIPLIEVGLRWCVHHSKLQLQQDDGYDGIILGYSSYNQLQQNVEACEKAPLPEEVVQALDRAWDICRGDAATYWR